MMRHMQNPRGSLSAIVRGFNEHGTTLTEQYYGEEEFVTYFLVQLEYRHMRCGTNGEKKQKHRGHGYVRQHSRHAPQTGILRSVRGALSVPGLQRRLAYVVTSTIEGVFDHTPGERPCLQASERE